MPSVALVACIFAGNITAILENASAFLIIIAAVSNAITGSHAVK